MTFLFFCMFSLPTASIAAEGHALCQIASGLSNVRINVYDGQNYVTTYPFGPYVHYLQWWEGSGVKHGYNPSNSTCYYDTSVPLHQPDWCVGYWSNNAIGCDQYYSITSLSINGNSWTKAAKIPTAIGALTNLRSIQLSNMGLSGPIPSSLGGLSRLSWLNLQNNMLTGSVPSFVGSMPSVSLYNNCNLTSSIPVISNQMSNGRVGTCSDDRTTIAAEGRALCSIARAWSNVQINSYSMASLSNVLKPVFSSSNNWDTSMTYGYDPASSTCYYNTSMPLHQPVWCTYWSGISCSNNKVTSLSISASSWTNTAKIPTALGALTNLQYLYLSNMGLTGSIPNLMSLSRLSSLSLSNNMLTGVVPQFVNRTTSNTNNNNYYYIYLYNNCNLTSPIPKLADRMTNQGGQYCKPDIAAIAADGQAMCALGKAWSNMQMSQWTGHNYTMTNVFGSFSYTSDQSLRRTGYIPGKSTCYYYTNGTHASTSSYQPGWCSWPGVSCTNNRVSQLSINNPTWTKSSKIPTAIGALTNLRSIQLSNIGLSGPIPSSLGGLSRLSWLNLQNNMLTGSVPSFVGSMPSVSLYNNCNLTSSIPVISNQMSNGRVGTCSDDRTTIAAEGRALCSIARAWSNVQINSYSMASLSNVLKPVFSSSNNWDTSMTYGYDPASSTCYYNTSMPLHQPVWCTYWSGISCSNNKVTSLSISASSWTNTAKIPTALGALTNLQYLYLSNMGLTGSIPNLMSLSRLSSLSLSNNMLTGVVPQFVNRTTSNTNNNNYYYIYLYNNCNLTSPIPKLADRMTNQGGQYCKPDIAAIAADGQAMCALGKAWSNMQMSQWTGHNYTMTNVFGSFSYTSDQSLRRTGYIPGKSTCYYYANGTHTSTSSYQPAWCSWPGVWCNNNRVYMIQIQNPTWTKTSKIPSALGALGNLQNLLLSYAGLSGSIPNLVGLSRLQTLRLPNNRLTGAVPGFINTMTTKSSTYVDLNTNCNLTWTSTSPVATGSVAYYGDQGNCAPLKPGKLLPFTFINSNTDFYLLVHFNIFPSTHTSTFCRWNYRRYQRTLLRKDSRCVV